MIEIYINGFKRLETCSTFKAISFIRKNRKKGQITYYCDDDKQNEFIFKYTK